VWIQNQKKNTLGNTVETKKPSNLLKTNILKTVCNSLGLPHAPSLSLFACLHELVSCVYVFFYFCQIT